MSDAIIPEAVPVEMAELFTVMAEMGGSKGEIARLFGLKASQVQRVMDRLSEDDRASVRRVLGFALLSKQFQVLSQACDEFLTQDVPKELRRTPEYMDGRTKAVARLTEKMEFAARLAGLGVEKGDAVGPTSPIAAWIALRGNESTKVTVESQGAASGVAEPLRVNASSISSADEEG